MNRYRDFGALDDQPEIVGDAAFTKLDMLADPATLPAVVLSESQNIRFGAKGTDVRKGIQRQFPAGTSIGAIYYCGLYKPLGGADQFALVCDHKLVLFRPDNQTLTAINFPAGMTGGAVQTVQAGLDLGTLPQLYLLRGLPQTTLQYDGGSTLAAAPGFPNAEFALFYQNRLAVKASEQKIDVSDFDDFTVWSTLNQFQILKGGDDYLTLFQAYQNDYVLIGTFKRWCIAFFDPKVGTGGYSGGLSDSSFLRQLTEEAGPVGPEAACEALGQIWFIGSDGNIYAFTPQLDQTLTVLGKPISADIQPIMDRLSAKYANGAAVKHSGYRLYFAMPISDLPVAISAVSITNSTTLGVDVPFDVPVNVASGNIVTVTTATAHGLNVGDEVLVAGVVNSELNGQFSVSSAPDDFTFSYATDIPSAAILGSHGTVQQLATRNNVIAVYNLNTNGWESIDTLPSGFYADWLRIADYGAQRRLWIVDATAGPALYEQGESDQIGDVAGGVDVPFDVPVNFSEANYASTPIAASFTTRAYRWLQAYSNPGSAAYPQKVNRCEVRADMDGDDAVTLKLTVRTPNNTVWTGERSFLASQFRTNDAPLRKKCGLRALEAQVQIQVTSGRPTFRSVVIETANVGRVED